MANVLFIEDDRALVDALSMAFEDAGHAVLAAFDGKEGLARALRDRPDVVICDVQLPRLDGFSLCRALRACADGISGPLSAERAERLARVLSDSTARLDALVSRFLEIARAEAGLPNEERTVIDAAALVRGLLAAASEDERHAGVRFEASGESAPIEGAAGPLESALRNIVENAASFAGEGG